MTAEHLITLPVLALMGLAIFAAGCRTSTPPPDHDTIPAGMERDFYAARRAAIEWYAKKYRETPTVPFVRLELVPDARLSGAWAATPSSTRIIARASVPAGAWRGVLEHEWKHVLNKANRKMDGELEVK